jgi:hypothetical protein
MNNDFDKAIIYLNSKILKLEREQHVELYVFNNTVTIDYDSKAQHYVIKVYNPFGINFFVKEYELVY